MEIPGLRKKLAAARARQLAKELQAVADEKKPITIPSPTQRGKVYEIGDACPLKRKLLGNPPVVQDTVYQPISRRKGTNAARKSVKSLEPVAGQETATHLQRKDLWNWLACES